jgi:nitrogen fixation protein FixH
LLVVGLIGLNMAIVTITVVKALGDESMATEPAYYERAMRFNEIAAERDASSLLGWQPKISLEMGTSEPTLSLALRDSAGLPVEGCTVQVELFANTRASSRQSVVLAQVSRGEYASSVRIDRAGLWTLRIRAVRHEQVFVHEAEVLVQGSEQGGAK